MGKSAAAVSGSIRDRLRRARSKAFVGRAGELELLERCFEDDGPAVVFVHGIGGIGKTALLDAFESRAAARGVRVLRLDGRSVEPTPHGLCAALGLELGVELGSTSAAVTALAALRGKTSLIIDNYELLRLLDSWLRRELVPALPSSVRVVVCGRSAPVGAWAGWQSLICTLRLTALDDASARALLEQRQVPAGDISRIQRFANGHPLALELAAIAVGERPELPIEQIESRHVVEVLARMYLEDARDPEARAALEAAAVVRRVTRSLLAAMLGEAASQRALEHLAALGFVERAPDGLVVDASVRQAIDAALRAFDPRRHHELRCAAWRCLRQELRAVRRGRSWSYVADILFLMERTPIRDAFFPADEHLFAIEPALPADRDAIRAITERFDAAAGVEAIRAWWQHAPEAFHIARDRDGRASGYYLLARAAQLDDAICARDPVASRWRDHLAATGTPLTEPVLLSRRMLAAETGEALSDVRAACWLDVKRTYLENPSSRCLYLATLEPELSYPALRQLGFRWLRDLSTPGLGQRERAVETFSLDFGARGILGWIERLLDDQLPVADLGAEQSTAAASPIPSRPIPSRPVASSPVPAPQIDACAACRLDLHARELSVDGVRVSLTPREFGLLSYLSEHPARVIERDELLSRVWQQDFGGSNVVDAAVRSLRKKLGPYAGSIQTVKGFGYRFDGFRTTGSGIPPSGRSARPDASLQSGRYPADAVRRR